MKTYIVRQINEFTQWKLVSNDTDDRTKESITKRQHVADELVVTSRTKAKSVAAYFLDNIKNDVYCRFQDDVEYNAGNPYEYNFDDQKDVPRLYTIYKRLRKNIGEWECNIRDRFGFPSYRDTENKYIERSLSKYSIDRLLEDNPNFIPDEELTDEILDRCYKHFSQKGKPVKVTKHSLYERQRKHTPKIDMTFHYDHNEDVLLNMKEELDTAWDNYMDSIQLQDVNLEGKEGKTRKYQLTNKYYLDTAAYIHRQEHPRWNDSGRAHRTWIEVLVITPTKHTHPDEYEYDMWLKDEEAQAEAQAMKEREAEMRLFAAESGHNCMVMNEDGSYETWREF